MANWCFNNVTFKGPQENLQTLLKILEDMNKRCEETGMGVIPILQEGTDDGYYFNITVEDENVNEDEDDVDEMFIQIRYDTKWSPNVNNLQWFGLNFGVDFLLEYEESGNQMYGHYRFMYSVDSEEDSILQHRFLTDEEHDQCMFLESDDGLTRHYRHECTQETWDELIEEDGWNQMEDYEQLEDTLIDKEWE
jgi:hypothetical protein